MSPKKKPDVIYVKPWIYIENQYDGSAAVRFFNTKDEAETYAEPDDERYCDDICQVIIAIDPKTLKICNIDEREKEDD